MFDLDWSKLMLIAVIAVVFIGPKELPSALRTLGKWVAKARTMAGEFQRNVDDMMREADLQDIKKSVDEIRGIASSPTTLVEKAIDPKGELRSAFAPPEFGSLEPPADKLAAITPPAATTPGSPAPVSTAPGPAPQP
ncbi:MAG: twin-arginine translocase subunit TatB, partial [Alphaproteobacteria bacterium]|nr:twin-arginine translocase subunit TatB [Alphaproteobacteria bacterium]